MNPKEFTITKVSNIISYHTKKPVFAVFFKGDDGKSYKTWLDPKNGNFKRWGNWLHVGNVLKGIRIKHGNLLDADSSPVLAHEPNPNAIVKADIQPPKIDDNFGLTADMFKEES